MTDLLYGFGLSDNNEAIVNSRLLLAFDTEPKLKAKSSALYSMSLTVHLVYCHGLERCRNDVEGVRSVDSLESKAKPASTSCSLREFSPPEVLFI